MATVFITSFPIAFCDYKMDADCDETRRDYISRRENRWSMNSQRLEEIVAELMKPISDVRRSFDTDLSALLEEYLTEAGLHALEEEDSGSVSTLCQSPAPGLGVAPNFAELALLLQQSASIYGRKVDFLYQHVLSVSDNLQNNALEESSRAEPAAGEATPAGSRRKRKASVGADFARIELEPCAAATRDDDAPRPPPTLPRLYVELEPRVLSSRDAQLTDYAGESIGVLADFLVAWRLQDGLLVEQLQSGETERSPLRAVPLAELQAAISLVAPPPLPLERVSIDILPPECRTPLPPECRTPLPPEEAGEAMPPPKLQRKRRSEGQVEDIAPGTLKLLISKELRRQLKRPCEFSLPGSWVAELVARRRNRIVSERARHRHSRDKDKHFRGFDESQLGGFYGWEPSEADSARLSVSAARESLALSDIAALTGAAVSVGGTAVSAGGAGRASDSDDDGFFEQSSLGDSDASRVDDTMIHTSICSAQRLEWTAWQARVVAAAAAGEARGGGDVTLLAERLLRALPDPPAAAPSAPAPARAFTAVLAGAAEDQEDVSKLFLATLFLANAGNVEILPGAPLSLDTFGVRVLSRDRARYAAALAAEPPAHAHSQSR